MSSFRNLYIHIPFCRSKCDYCAFYSEAGREDLIAAYLCRLKEDIVAADLPDAIDTVYIGGGTPTLLSPQMLRELIPILPQAEERTIEANPETLNPEKISILADNFSRISLGVQSFDPQLRHILGRDCSQNAIENALKLIDHAQFRHWNIDLIYGIGTQTLSAWEWELEQAMNWPIDHLSCYALTREENTRLAPDAQTLDHEEREADMAELTREVIHRRLTQYEISNYACPGGECRHNLNVWHGKRYLGIGAAAASFDGKDRWNQAADIEAYINNCSAEIDILAPGERAREVFAVNLRTVEGWNSSSWREAELAVSIDWTQMVEKIAIIAEKYPGLIDYGADFIRLTQRGRDFWDIIAGELI